MDHGKILAKGTLEQLLNIHDKGEIIEFSLQERPESLKINLGDTVRESAWDGETQKGRLLVDEIVTAIPGFMEFILSRDYHLTSFECRKMTLEDLFISLTGRKLRDEE
jgi:ABC-2 type transport system ATP-binding protein